MGNFSLKITCKEVIKSQLEKKLASMQSLTRDYFHFP